MRKKGGSGEEEKKNGGSSLRKNRSIFLKICQTFVKNCQKKQKKLLHTW
jgi:hypothetical protein